MTENRTSQAVDEHYEDSKQLRGGSMLVSIQELQAIAEKYKRMEEALQRLSVDSFSGDPSASDAREALAFDPLSQDEK